MGFIEKTRCERLGAEIRRILDIIQDTKAHLRLLVARWQASIRSTVGVLESCEETALLEVLDVHDHEHTLMEVS